jgi:amidohydrolase
MTLDEIREAAEELAKDLHANPETSLNEWRASENCCKLLAEWGFDVVRGVAGLATAFSATASVGTGEGPTVGLVAEFDALPNVGHGCGHHLIAGGVLEAAGRLVTEQEGDGQIRVLGTPGEEEAAGKGPMLAAGAFDGVDAAVTYHPLDDVGVFGHLNGAAILDLVFKGVSTHAASTPWAGRSAQDGTVLAATALSMERQYLVEGSRIHPLLSEVTGSHNVFPDRAVLRVNTRAPTVEELDRQVRRVEQIAQGAAMATNTEVSVEMFQSAKPYVMHRGLAELAWRVMGLPSGTAIDLAGSSDLGDISVALPTVTVLETGWTPTTWHAPELHEASGTDGAYESMHRAADAMVGIATAILTGDQSWR